MSFTGKLLLGMLLLCLPMQALGWDWHTRVTVALKDRPLLEACQLLEQQYGIRFSYSRNVVDLSHKVTLEVRNRPLKKVLEALMSPYDIAYTRIGEQLVLTMKEAPRRTISGYVEDAITGEKLIGATVYSPVHQVGTTTNQYGFYSLTLKKDTNSLAVSYVGYSPQQQPLPATGNRQFTVVLQPLNSLQEVVVTENMQPRLQEQTQMSKLNISTAEVKAMPKLLGEADVLRTIQSMPGVSGGMEGSGGMNVRGGSPDQNLILLDGTPVFNSSHVFGIFSVFNPDIVKNTDLYKGAFPARYGGRLSSVVDIAMKDGDMKDYHGEVAIGLIAAKFTVEGPIWKDKTSFIVSGRRSYTDLILNDFLNKNVFDVGKEGSAFAFFYDASVRINHIFSPKDRIYLSAYGGQDVLNTDKQHDFPGQYKENTNFRLGWGNLTGTLRWNHVFNQQLFSNVTFNYSQYFFLTDYRYNYESYKITEKADLFGRYQSRIQNAVGKIDFDYRPNPRHAIKFGVGATTHIFKPGATFFEDYTDDPSPTDTAYNNINTVGVEMVAYAEDDWEVNKSLHINAGLHASGFLVEGRFYKSFQPRLGMRLMVPKNWALKLAYTHMSQNIHLLTNNSTNLPTDLWVPSTQKVRPMLSKQVSTGVAKTSRDHQYEFSLEGYYKTMDNVIEYKEDALFFGTNIKRWDERVEIGSGKSYGMELMMEKKKGGLKGWIGYTLSWSDRQFPGVNKGRPFPYKYDRRHELELVLSQRLGKYWEVSVNWQYGTGSALTLPVASYEGAGEPSPWEPGQSGPPRVDYLGERNHFRTPDVHRLDVSFTYTRQKKHWTKSWNFSVYNAYNQKNGFFYYVKTDMEKKERYLAKLCLLPILPSITYSVRF